MNWELNKKYNKEVNKGDNKEDNKGDKKGDNKGDDKGDKKGDNGGNKKEDIPEKIWYIKGGKLFFLFKRNNHRFMCIAVYILSFLAFLRIQ